MLAFNRFGTLPTRNFQSGTFEGAIHISPEEMSVTANARAPDVWPARSAASTSTAVDGQGVRIEYESLFALGSLCGISDSGAVLSACRRCDELGLDTISTGGTIAFAMECVERRFPR
jgi:aldehyde:ferredoxin oxidoreductase